MTVSTASKANNNDDIYLNNGNAVNPVRPKLPNISVEENSTKVEAESERGASREKVKKVVPKGSKRF